jgi:tetratricopeptide (TPR) repeat protein
VRHGMARLRRLGACVVLLALSPASAEAQDDDAYPATIAEAVAEFQAGNWAEAKTLFRKAHQLRPSARTLRGLGIVAFELRQYVEAADYLRQALADRRNPLSPAQKEATRAQIERAASFIGRFDVEISPEDASISVDGSPASLQEGALLLDVGPHEVTVSAPGHRSQSRKLLVEGGTVRQLEFHLSPSAAPRVPPAHVRPAAPPRPPAESQATGIPTGAVAVAGIGAAALLASAVTGTMALAAARSLEDACGPVGIPCDERHADKAHRAEDLALATDVLWISGGALLGTGLIWWLSSSGNSEPPADVSFSLSRDAAGVRFRGRL